MKMFLGLSSFFSLVCWSARRSFECMHIHVSLFDVHIFLSYLKRRSATTQESKRLLIFKGRMLAGVAGSRTEQTPKEATGGGRTGVRPRQVPSRTPGVSRRSVTISLTSIVPKRCELSPCQASPGRSLALTPLNGYRMESQERGGEPGARQAHLSGTKGQRGVQISSQGVT